MANEFKHKDPGGELTQAEFIAACGDGHIFACQATGDIVYASSATVLSKLAKGAANTVLSMGGSCIPAWTASPSVTDLTIGGGCITLSAATDIDLTDNVASALSFDASGKAGIINIVTTDCSEGVTMSGTLGVTGVLTATGGLAGGAICIGSSTITTTGLISGGSLDIDNVLINGTTIGHTCDTDLMTVADASLTIKGDITVGVDDTGHDVKFFGAAAGAFMLYDQSCDLLEIRGATAAGPGHLKLTTGEATVVANDVLGKIEFQAPAECGTDAVKVSATIAAVAQGTFAANVNATDLIFYTGHDNCAAERFRFTSQNEIGIAGANYGTDGQVLTSGGGGAAVAWEDAGGGDVVDDTSPQLGAHLDMNDFGLDFSNQTSSADGDVFDEYEEGTWTPFFCDQSVNASESQAHSAQVGTYTKIGNRFLFSMNIVLSDKGSLTEANSARIGGLPVAIAALEGFSIGPTNGMSITAGYSVSAGSEAGQSFIVLGLYDTTSGATALQVSECQDSFTCAVNGAYRIA